MWKTHLCRGLVGAMALAATAIAGCTQNQFDDHDSGLPAAQANGPGSVPWADENLVCKQDSDCATGAGEACINGLCQMKRCSDATHTSAAPFGQHRLLLSFRDVLVGDVDNNVRGYEPVQSQLVHSQANEWLTEGSAIIDVAGGNFFGARPEVMAVAHDGASQVDVISPSGDIIEIDVGFTPVSIAAGDVDADGVDELLAIGSDGTGAVCHVKDMRCDPFAVTAEGATQTILDLAAGDVDGDGYEEPVVLVDAGGSQLVVVNLDADATTQKKLVRAAADATLSRIAAGDVDGTGVAQIVGLELGEISGGNLLRLRSD